jgi:hypothetical protein
MEACSYAERGSWLAPDAGAPGMPSGPRNSDAKAKLVGQWASCQKGTLVQRPHSGIEFAANGRWQLLGGSEAVAGPRGTYYFMNIGQLNTASDDQNGSSVVSGVQFSPDGLALREEGHVYVRLPTPANYGSDNPPSITDGTCTLVGTWDSESVDQGAKPLSISFDALGNFVAGDVGADLCASHSMYGTYRLTAGFFELTQNIGMGLCDFWFSAKYPATFADGCSRMNLTQMYDNCTGGRGYLNGRSTLVKRR